MQMISKNKLSKIFRDFNMNIKQSKSKDKFSAVKIVNNDKLMVKIVTKKDDYDKN